jgi:hypothetical protein
MNFSKKYLTIIVLAITASACGEVSYKRGASVRDIESAHKACRGVSETEFSSCLQKQGWEVQKFDDSDLFAETSVTDNRGTPPANADKSAFVEVQEKPHADASNADKVVQSKEAQTEQMQKTENTVASKASESASTAANTPAAETKVEKKPAPAPVDPMKTYKINSWWKFGGTPTQLKADQTSCVATLGEAHQPDMATQTYTRGLIECLHKNGWKALKAIK